MNNAWPWMAMNNGGFGGLGNGLGAGVVGFILGALINGNGNGLFGNGGNNAGAAAASLGAQATALNNTDLLMNAITSSGERQHEAVQTLSTMLGQDFNLVNSAVGNVQNALQTLALQQAVSVPQIINSIQSGDAALASAFQNCCCENRLSTCQQTNTLQNAINGVGNQVQAKAAADQLAMCQQTYALTDTMNRNYLALDNKIDAMESSRKDREIAAKDAEIATLKSQNFTAGLMAQSLAPVNAALASLNKEVDDIKCKLPNTINVEYPQVSVVNTTPYVGGFYGNWFNGWGGNVVF
jgi:hypothetical protein